MPLRTGRDSRLAVSPLLIEVEDDPHPTGSSGNRQARARVAEGLAAAPIHSLQAVDLTPGHTPGAPVALELLPHLLQGADAVPGSFLRRIPSAPPLRKDCHGHGIDPAH